MKCENCGTALWRYDHKKGEWLDYDEQAECEFSGGGHFPDENPIDEDQLRGGDR